MKWFALTVRPQHERAVAERLAAKALEVYVPTYRSRRRWSDRVKMIELPLFPQYVFCQFGFEERLNVLSTLSVNSIVSFGGRPYPLDDQEIAAIKRIEASDVAFTPWPFLRAGQRIRICGGPLKGLEGILAREKAAYRVVVNVNVLQRAVAVEIDRALLEPAPSDEIAWCEAASAR
jgi:transcription antitermination factor NusG